MKAVKVIIAIAAIAVAGWFVYRNFEVRQTADLNNRALRLIEQDKFAEARDLLEQATKRAPANPSLWKNLGNAYQGLNDVPRAVAAFERSLLLNPSQADVRETLDTLKKGAEADARIIEKLQAEVVENPNDAQILARAGATYETLDEFARAIEMYERSLKIDPNQPDVRKRLEALKKKQSSGK